MKLECKRCGYKWEYKGTGYMYTSCPRCRTNVKLNGDRNEREGKNKDKAG